MRGATSPVDAAERAPSAMLSRSASDGDAAASREEVSPPSLPPSLIPSLPPQVFQAARCSSTGELESSRPRRKWKRYRRVLGPEDEFEVMMAAMSYVDVKTVAAVGDLAGDTQPAASLASQVSPPRCGAKRGTRCASLELAHAIDCSASVDRQLPGGASARGLSHVAGVGDRKVAFQRVRFQDAALPASTGEGDLVPEAAASSPHGAAGCGGPLGGGHTTQQRVPGTPGVSPEKSATPASGDATAEQRAPRVDLPTSAPPTFADVPSLGLASAEVAAAPDTATADHNPAHSPHVRNAPGARLCPDAGLPHPEAGLSHLPEAGLSQAGLSHAVPAAAPSPSHQGTPTQSAHCSPTRGSHPKPQSSSCLPPWRRPRGKWMVSLVNSHTNATSSRWHLWEVD